VFTLKSEDVLDVPVPTTTWPTRYPYAVYGHKIGDFVPGESSPDNIIDR
jgi:hypothetical protein